MSADVDGILSSLLKILLFEGLTKLSRLMLSGFIVVYLAAKRPKLGRHMVNLGIAAERGAFVGNHSEVLPLLGAPSPAASGFDLN